MKKEPLLAAIINGIQEKKGKQIAVIDLKGIENAICRYLIITQGNTPSQVSAICDEIWERARVEAGEKPAAIDGQNNSMWVAMDYGTVIAHVFLPEQREYYNLEHLWADAHIEHIPDID